MADNNDDDFDEAGFYEKCDEAKRKHDRDSGIYEAEIERLALLSDLAYQIERKAAARRLNNISVVARTVW